MFGAIVSLTLKKLFSSALQLFHLAESAGRIVRGHVTKVKVIWWRGICGLVWDEIDSIHPLPWPPGAMSLAEIGRESRAQSLGLPHRLYQVEVIGNTSALLLLKLSHDH